MCIGGKEGEPNYPGSMVKTGEILTLSKWMYVTGDVQGRVHKENVEKFPHLFKPLQWWEFRKVDDMPEFVRLKDKGIFKVDVWDFIYEEAMIFNGDLISTVSIELLTPSTSEEYDEYLKQKEG